MYNNDVGKKEIYEVKRHSNKHHPLCYFISYGSRERLLSTTGA
jgi:hypothetical protein